jgi:hypothetical protein
VGGVSAAVPVFTQLRFADCPTSFRAWLLLDHGLNDKLAEALASILSETCQVILDRNFELL